MTMIVAPEETGKRLDTVAGTMVPGSSRNQIQKLIKDGVITVNGKKVSPHHFLKEGDTITLSSRAERSEERDPDVHTNPRIITETDEYLILDKPAGMVVHGGVRRESATLVDWLLVHFPEIRKAGEDPLRPGIVHRLDKDASGVMVIARTQESFESLVRQFKLRQVKKEYRILVYGHVTPNEGIIDLPIGRSKKLYTKRAVHVNGTRAAVTRYVVLEQYKQTSLVQVIPETGRTHQIRVHFFAKGNPIVGDKIYSLRKKSSRIALKPFGEGGRLMLHAERLGFHDRAGHWQEYTVPPGDDFQIALSAAKNA